ncbi:NAD(P)H-binding protein [Saccharopolyspora sp. WRP15-2]|uniref:NAD(P)H-binding protein n=1 Tax=Saccharopolyspora oryzae TaxID=2997343 RepID=A0ABT4UU98_9PSEU|nr:NAD(P)H-binding protein [Saccharopolyspora oryzae]MDA3625300.1 NAD(P)H-binding protein [Saccharopolyspora oryzae]
MILVTGATGNVGSEVASALAAAGHPVRAMTRRPHEARTPDGVEVVYGDAEDPASLDEAFRGVDRAFLMTSQQVGTAPRPTHDISLAAAAQRAGVAHLVKLSVYGAGRGDDVIDRWHAEAEAAVVSTGIDHTILRPGRFMSNALHWAPMIRRGDQVRIPFAHRPTAAIAPADIATIAVSALTTDEHRNAVHQLSGPQVLTPAQELSIIGEELGRHLQLAEPSLGETRAGLRRSGMSPEVVDAVLNRAVGSDDGAQVLPAMPGLLGRQPTTFADWVRTHIDSFAHQENDDRQEREDVH